MIIARLSTTNFMFEAAGNTQPEARAALVAGLEAHGREYRCEAGWYKPFLGEGEAEVRYTALTPGTCLRDREVIFKPWSEVPLTAPKPLPGQSDEDAIAEDKIANGYR